MRNNALKPIAVALFRYSSVVGFYCRAVSAPKIIGQAYQGGVVFYVDLDDIWRNSEFTACLGERGNIYE